jgi:hypothetical protein
MQDFEHKTYIYMNHFQNKCVATLALGSQPR